MSHFTAHAPSQDPAGLLVRKPWAWLKRLRPVKLEALGRVLLDQHRLGLGLSLISTHFPAELAQYNDLSGVGWWEVLARLVNLVEGAGWFEINWPVLNEAWAYWLGSEDENGEHLAVFLEYIPVTLYGLTDGETIFEVPVLELLHALLADCEIQTVSAQLLLACEIYDNLDDLWQEHDRQAAWALLHQIEADPGLYPEPVRWLPELARWACHRTGNVMLDRSFDPHRDGPWFSWAEELEEVKHAWRRAQPVRQAFDRVQAWVETDPGHLADLANFIMYGGTCDTLNW